MGIPKFAKMSSEGAASGSAEDPDVAPGFRRVYIPANRYSPLIKDWKKITDPLVKHLKLDVRYNKKMKAVELRTSDKTVKPSALLKGAEFIE
ncbi:hypothetical protein KIPB_014102, partial [Kipferlia bialata]|eukprot:g14102.t1